MKAILIGTALAVAFASYAGAAEVKQAKSLAPVKAQKMSDTEMDKVTAGSNGIGHAYAFGHSGQGRYYNHGVGNPFN
jgi:opacity protein-like surface antigen